MNCLRADAVWSGSTLHGTITKPTAILTHDGRWVWKNGAELVWECDDDCPATAHDDEIARSANG